MTDDFNLELCQLKLYILLSTCHNSSLDTETEAASERSVDILVQEAASSFRSNPGTWARLISILPRGHAEMVGPPSANPVSF